MPRFEAVLLDYGNTVAQFDRPQIERIHVQLADFLSRTVASVDPTVLGEVMDRVCVLATLSEDRRELTPVEQMELVLREVYARPFRTTDQAVLDANEAYQELYVTAIEVDDATVRALEQIAARVRLGLVSNYPCGATLRRTLSAAGIADRFDPIVISGEVGYVKPHPKVFQVALEGIGVPAERVLFVGDSWASDMVGSREAGMSTCHHLGLASEQDHSERYSSYRPDFTIRHLDELLPILAVV